MPDSTLEWLLPLVIVAVVVLVAISSLFGGILALAVGFVGIPLAYTVYVRARTGDRDSADRGA